MALISSIAIRVTSFSTVSLIAIVPDSECSTPTLMVVRGIQPVEPAPMAATAADMANCLMNILRFIASPSVIKLNLVVAAGRLRKE